MTTVNFNLVYPPVLNNNNNLQYIKFSLPLSTATTYQVWTTALNQGRFFCTKVVLSDFVGGAGVGSVVLSFGSISNTSNASTGILPNWQLAGTQAGAVANQFVQLEPGLMAFAGVTTSSFNGSTPPVALSEGDVMTAYVSVAANGTTGASCYVHVQGFYL